MTGKPLYRRWAKLMLADPGPRVPAPVANVPIWMSETEAVRRQRAPSIGEHTDAALGEPGDSADAIATPRAQSVV